MVRFSPGLEIYLRPANKVPGIGRERGRKVRDGIARYVDPYGSNRYVFYVEGEPVSALQVVVRDVPIGQPGEVGYRLEERGVVANVYTLPEKRRMGYAAKLLARARKDFPVEHAPERHRTTAGSAWATAVRDRPASRRAVHSGMALDDYDKRELAIFRKEMNEIEKQPLDWRKQNYQDLLADREAIDTLIDRVDWLLNGSYGRGAQIEAEKVAANPRMNRAAWFAQRLLAYDYRVPQAMAIQWWRTLSQAERRRLEDGILDEIEKRGGAPRPRSRAKRDRATSRAGRRESSSAKASQFVARGRAAEEAGDPSTAAIWFKKAGVEYAKAGVHHRARYWTHRAEDVRKLRKARGPEEAVAYLREPRPRRKKRTYRRDPQRVCPVGTAIQTVVLDERYFNQRQAESWIRRHGFDLAKIDRTGESYRFRQRPPSSFEEGTFRTISLRPGVKAVIGCPL